MLAASFSASSASSAPSSSSSLSRANVIQTGCHGVSYGSVVIITLHYNSPISAADLAEARARFQNGLSAGMLVAVGLRPSEFNTPATTAATVDPADAHANMPSMTTAAPLDPLAHLNLTTFGSEDAVMSTLFPSLTSKGGYVMLAGIVLLVLLVTGILMGFVLKDGHLGIGLEHDGPALARSTIVSEGYGKDTSMTSIGQQTSAGQRKYAADLVDWSTSRYVYGYAALVAHTPFVNCFVFCVLCFVFCVFFLGGERGRL